MKYTLLLLFTVCSQLPLFTQPQKTILLDDFENHPLNSLGGVVQGFKDKATITKETIDGRRAFLNSGSSLEINYDVSGNTAAFGGLVSVLPNLDLSTFYYLSFWVKGTKGREYFYVELGDSDDKAAKVAVWNYLECGPSTEWQKVVIPLDAFWNLGDRNRITKVVIGFDYFSSHSNGSPLESSIQVDELIVGSHFPGYLKIDSFDDGLKSNALGGNIGEFSQNPNTGNYASELYFVNESNCDRALKIDYNNGGDDEYGGVFFILGGGLDGWSSTLFDVSKYDKLTIALGSPSSTVNPGAIDIELKSDNIVHTYEILGIELESTTFSAPFASFSPPIGRQTSLGEFVIVFDRDDQRKLSGTLLVDSIAFAREGFETPDMEAPPIAGSIMVNGQNAGGERLEIPSDLIAELSTNIEFVDSKLESVRIEIFNSCEWQCLSKNYAPLSTPTTFTIPTNQLPTDIPLQMRVVAQNYNGRESYSEPFEVLVESDDPLDVDQLLRYAFDAVHSLRYETGVYLDATVFQGEPFHPASVATTGMGLISLCIGNAMGYLNNAEMLVEETLRAMNGLNEGFTPERNCYGWFRHFIDQTTGIQAWDSEFSSIDSGILIAGALFCKKYFKNNTAIAQLADSLYLSTKWSSMLADADTGGIYLTADELGRGGTGITLPFNEYMIVAWLAKNDIRDDSLATSLWDQHFADPAGLPKSSYEEIEVLTDRPGGFLSNFVPQFVYYLCNYYTTHPDYNQYFENAMKADSLWWRNNTDTDCFVWGFGAGASTTDSGYHADDIGNHPSTIASPHIIGGFIPVNPDLVYDLVNLYRTSPGLYEMPNPEKTPVLWRYSYDSTAWRANDIQGIDFSSMLLGLAAHPDALGGDFFTEYNDFDFPSNGPLPSCLTGTRDLCRDPNVLSVRRNHPNPFRQSTLIEFTQNRRMQITFTVIDTGGREVFRQDLGRLLPGDHQIQWNGQNKKGEKLPAGLYFFKIQSDRYFDMKKLMIIR